MRRSKLVGTVLRWMVALGGGAMMGSTLCDGKMGLEFRTAATSSIQAGVQSIVTGVIDGLFAVIEPDTSS